MPLRAQQYISKGDDRKKVEKRSQPGAEQTQLGPKVILQPIDRYIKLI